MYFKRTIIKRDPGSISEIVPREVNYEFGAVGWRPYTLFRRRYFVSMVVFHDPSEPLRQYDPKFLDFIIS